MRLYECILCNLLCGMEITDLTPRERMNPLPVFFDQYSEGTFITRQDAFLKSDRHLRFSRLPSASFDSKFRFASFAEMPRDVMSYFNGGKVA